MDIKIHSLRFDADIKLLEFIHSKIEKLNLFFDDILSVEIWLRLDRSQDLENKLTEIKLTLPGAELFAKKQSRTFEEATDLAIEALRRQIHKHKGKLKRA
ncbi:MAG: ribosome-associated translation inhibitor RaiA [Bacteroidales bacterium]|nr:ribosome-associated translation inhibitor RaiA [Bacteroidales bacterium]